MTRLTPDHVPPPGIAMPAYTPQDHGVGIVHIGVGAFHRAHQAVYTDDALSHVGGDWRIVGASLRSTGIADALNAQGGRYTVISRGNAGDHARIIASIASVIAASRTLSWAGVPLGATLGGTVGRSVGVDPVYLGASTALLLVAVVLTFNALWRHKVDVTIEPVDG